MLLGDFNAYHPLWGCYNVDSRGAILESFIDWSNLIILNNGAPTHPNESADTAIDLSLCSPSFSEDFEWNTLPSVLDSDHYPITITTHIENTEPPPIRVMSKANWNIYMDSQAWNNIPQEIGSNEGSLEDIYRRINTACEEAIPTIVPSRFYPKPFWTPDLTRSRAVREMLYQEYRRRPTLENKIRWKQGRAVHKGNVRRHKEKSWADFTSKVFYFKVHPSSNRSRTFQHNI